MNSERKLLDSRKIFLFFFLVACASAKIVEIDDGKILGTIKKSRNGKPFDAFLGIPYAQPPVGELRFKAPLPSKPWDEVRNGTFYRNFCYQQGAANEILLIDGARPAEDCLFLNVFTMNLPEDGEIDLKPVIVFIHGGGWEGGSGNWLDPFYLIDRDVILVTINYRLGALGFLSVGTADAIGNMALKDQNLALKWVQKNIENFGGDPSKVTITGSSAGGFSVTAHMVSPMSTGLFHRVLASSGAIAFQKKLESTQLPIARKLAEIVGCGAYDVAEMIKCLKSVPAKMIAAVSVRFIAECPLIPWLPVIEIDMGQERFFTEQPVDSLKHGNFSKVPLLIGMTTKEFIGPIPGILSNKNLMQQFNDNFEEVAPLCASYEFGSERSKKISEKFRQLYFQNDTIDQKSFESLGNLVSDGFISYAVHRFAHLAAKFTDVFYYKFSYVGTHGSFLYPRDKPYDSCHGDEQQYIVRHEEISKKDRENVMVERMTRIYSQFASAGTPNNENDPYLKEMNWPKLDDKNEYYLDIGEHFIEKHSFYLDRFKVWDEMDFESSDENVDEVLASTKYFFNVESFRFEEILALVLIFVFACIVVKLYHRDTEQADKPILETKSKENNQNENKSKFFYDDEIYEIM